MKPALASFSRVINPSFKVKGKRYSKIKSVTMIEVKDFVCVFACVLVSVCVCVSGCFELINV